MKYFIMTRKKTYFFLLSIVVLPMLLSMTIYIFGLDYIGWDGVGET